MDPIRELPYGPAACHGRIRGRTHVSTRSVRHSLPKNLLAPKGASTHVHDDDVARLEFRDEHPGHVSLEGVTVDGAVEHEGRSDPGQAQARHEGCGLPVPVRHACPEPLSSGRPAVAPCHVGRSPGFVDEDKAVGVEVELTLEPSLAPG